MADAEAYVIVTVVDGKLTVSTLTSDVSTSVDALRHRTFIVCLG